MDDIIDDIFKDQIDEIFKTPELVSLKDEEADYVNKPIRMLRDETTSIFTKYFLDDETKRKNFISYTFHIINTHIQLNINDNLVKKEKNPLSIKEAVYLVFKGGNVMNYYFTKAIVPTTVDNSNYKISDVDYSIYIKAGTQHRFDEIKKVVYVLLIEALTKISNIFNELYKNKGGMNKNDMYTFTYTENDTLKSLIEGLKCFRDIDEDNYIEKTNNILLKCSGDGGYDNSCVINNNTPNCTKYFDQLLLQLANLNNSECLIDLLVIYNMFYKCKYYYEHLGYDENNNDKYIYLNRVKTKLNELITKFINKELIKKIFNFYKNVNINDFINEVKTNITKKIQDDKILYEVLNGNLVTYNFTNSTGSTCSVKPNTHKFISSIEPNKTNISSSNTTYQHYISYNSIIYAESITEPVANKVKFDLARIKFNVELSTNYTRTTTSLGSNTSSIYTSDYGFICEYDTIETNKLNIPSEFIDVSIPDFIDTTGQHYIKTLNKNNEPHRLADKKNDLHVYSYSLLQIAEDLENVLFTQNIQILPWLDSKYEKRLNRLVLFLLLSCHFDNFSVDKTTKPTNATEKYNFIININNLCDHIINNNDTNITALCNATFKKDQYNDNYYNLSSPYNKDNYKKPTIKNDNELDKYGGELFISLIKHYNMFKSISTTDANKTNIINNYNILRWRLVKYSMDNIDNSYTKIMEQKDKFTTFVKDLKKVIESYIGTGTDNNPNEKMNTILASLKEKGGFVITTTEKGHYSILFNNKYKDKYLKYKNKYIILKKELNIN